MGWAGWAGTGWCFSLTSDRPVSQRRHGVLTGPNVQAGLADTKEHGTWARGCYYCGSVDGTKKGASESATVSVSLLLWRKLVTDSTGRLGTGEDWGLIVQCPGNVHQDRRQEKR